MEPSAGGLRKRARAIWKSAKLLLLLLILAFISVAAALCLFAPSELGLERFIAGRGPKVEL